MKSDRKKVLDIGKNLALVTQMGIMILAPIGLCMYVANVLINRFNLGNGAMIIAIILGIAAGFLNIYKILSGYFSNGKKNKNWHIITVKIKNKCKKCVKKVDKKKTNWED